MNKVTIPNDVMLTEVSRMLEEGHSVVFLAKGSSMTPFIKGDADSVELVRCDNPKAGDIVLAEVDKGRWVLHRVLKKVQGGFVLKGDGNLDGTEYCPDGCIHGVAVNIIKPNGKKVDCTSAAFIRRSEKWRALPRTARRIILGIYRRIK